MRNHFQCSQCNSWQIQKLPYVGTNNWCLSHYGSSSKRRLCKTNASLDDVVVPPESITISDKIRGSRLRCFCYIDNRTFRIMLEIWIRMVRLTIKQTTYRVRLCDKINFSSHCVAGLIHESFHGCDSFGVDLFRNGSYSDATAIYYSGCCCHSLVALPIGKRKIKEVVSCLVL